MRPPPPRSAPRAAADAGLARAAAPYIPEQATPCQQEAAIARTPTRAAAPKRGAALTDAEAPAKPARGRTAARTETPAAKAAKATVAKPSAAAPATRAPAKAKAASAATAAKPRATKAPRAATKPATPAAKAAEPAAARKPKRALAEPPAAPKPRARKAEDAPAKAPRATAARAAKAEATAPTPSSARAPKAETTTPKPAAAKRGAPKPAPIKQAAAAGPAAAPARARRAKAPPLLLDRMVAAAVASLEDDKAEDIVVLDISTRSSFADRMIVASGLSDRQLQAMARNVEEALAGAGWKRVRIEASPEWVLLDAGDVVIHLFRPATRETYGIERMWGPESPNG